MASAVFRWQAGCIDPGHGSETQEERPEGWPHRGGPALRFYGRKGKLPPLKDEQGKPTRFALSAHAWGEKVPKTVAEARAIAARGRRLLAAYEKKRKAAKR